MKSEWKVSTNVYSYDVWRQTRPLEPGEPMHSGVRKIVGSFDTREEAQAYADSLNKTEAEQ